MRMDRFTTLAQGVLSAAQEMAGNSGHPELSPLHMLAAMLEEPSGVTGSILAKSGINGTGKNQFKR